MKPKDGQPIGTGPNASERDKRALRAIRQPGPVIIPSSCSTGYYTRDGRPWLKFVITEDPPSPMGDHEVYLEGLRLQPGQDYVLALHELRVDPDAGKALLSPARAGLLRLVHLTGAKEVEVARWPFVAPKVPPEPAQGRPEPPPNCRVCGLPVPSPSYGGPDLCPACDCGIYRDGTPWDYKETTNPQLVRSRARAREEDGFDFLRPPRGRPLRATALATLKEMLELAQDAGRVAEAQALCVAIECIEQLPRLLNRTEPAPDCRRGANWTPPTEQAQGTVRCFLGQDEVCALCGRHIRDHFGGTEYRCDPAA